MKYEYLYRKIYFLYSKYENEYYLTINIKLLNSIMPLQVYRHSAT